MFGKFRDAVWNIFGVLRHRFFSHPNITDLIHFLARVITEHRCVVCRVVDRVWFDGWWCRLPSGIRTLPSWSFWLRNQTNMGKGKIHHVPTIFFSALGLRSVFQSAARTSGFARMRRRLNPGLDFTCAAYCLLEGLPRLTSTAPRFVRLSIRPLSAVSTPFAETKGSSHFLFFFRALLDDGGA